MVINLPLRPDVAKSLQEQAARAGQTLEEYLTAIALREAARANGGVSLSPEVRSAEWRAFVAGGRPTPTLADDSRESIYAGRGE
jgi:hypothetical protein